MKMRILKQRPLSDKISSYIWIALAFNCSDYCFVRWLFRNHILSMGKFLGYLVSLPIILGYYDIYII